MGRPTKVLTEAQKGEVETLAAVLTAAQTADYFAIGRTTFFALMDRDPGIAERYKRGKARAIGAIGAIAQGLIAKARGGDTASMIFYFKTQAGWRETTAVEHSTVDAVRLLTDNQGQHGSRWQAVLSISSKIGGARRTLNEGIPSVQGISECLGEVAFAGDAGKLGLCPCLEGFHFGACLFFTDSPPGIAGLTPDLALDVIKVADPVECVACDLGFGGGVDVEEVAAQMGPAGRLADAGLAGCIRCVKRLEAGIGVCLQDAGEPGQMTLRMLTLAVDREEVGRPRRRRVAPWPVISHIGPDATFFNAFADPIDAL